MSCRISRFLRGDIFAGALAKLLAGLSHVENVVDHLKSEAERAPEFGDGAQVLLAVAFALIAPRRTERRQNRGGLVFVNVTKLARG